MRWKALEGITRSDLGLRWLSLAVVWKLDWKRVELTKWTNIVKIRPDMKVAWVIAVLVVC